MAGLDQRGQLETLMLVVTGTRGERLDERRGPVGAHGLDLFDASVHVPLLVRQPARYLGGQLTDRLAMSIDLGPTLAELGLHQAWTGVRGESLAPVLRNHKPVRTALFSEGQVESDDGDRFYGYAMSSPYPLSSQSYKLISDLGGARASLSMRIKDPAERSLIDVAPKDFKALWARGDPWWQDCAKP
jgi:arylsulfatase A-like enzyme